MFGMTKDIGIDLGTANTLVYMRGKGIIIREPSVVAVDKKLQCVRYVGQEAKDVIGRTPGSIVAVRPLKDGVIADFDMTSSMLEQFIKKALRGRGKARVIICIPSGVTEVERRAVKEAAQNAGAKRVSIIEEPMAAAIGAGLPVAEPVGSMIDQHLAYLVGTGGNRYRLHERLPEALRRQGVFRDLLQRVEVHSGAHHRQAPRRRVAFPDR